MKEYDITVIGGGPAGYVAALKAADLGGKICLIEKDQLGGTCLNRGCIPTKAYLKNSEIIEQISHAASRGIVLGDPAVTIDMNQAVEMKNSTVKKLAGGIASLLRSRKVDVINSQATVNDDLTVTTDQGLISSQKIILATGSRAGRLPVPGVDLPGVMTSDEILDITDVPDSLAIIGGGVIGVEMARIFKSFGSRVTIVELEDRLVPFMDSELSTAITRSLEKQGVTVCTSVRVESIQDQEGLLNIVLDGGDTVVSERVLLAVGRSGDIDAVSGLDIDIDKGFLKVNSRMETSVAGIYAPGDNNGLNMLAHAASKMGEVAACNAMGQDHEVNLKNVPGVIYGNPEGASVGLTEAEARKGCDLLVGRFAFSGNGRAVASGEAEGFVKILVESRYREIVGVHIYGTNASELINEAATLMEMEITAEELADMIHAHPTYSEALMEAAAASLGRCIHA